MATRNGEADFIRILRVELVEIKFPKTIFARDITRGFAENFPNKTAVISHYPRYHNPGVGGSKGSPHALKTLMNIWGVYGWFATLTP